MPIAKRSARNKRNSAADMRQLARQAGSAAQLLKLLGNEKRLLILCYLAARGEMTVGDMLDVIDLGPSALSQHLAKLRGDRLIAYRRAAQTLHYRIADPRALKLLKLLKQIYCGDLT